MINPQLLQYVRAQRTAGVSKEDIVKALASGGWSAQDAQEAFTAIEGPPAPKPPPAAPKPPPVQTIGRTSQVSPPMTSAPMSRPAPTASTPQPMSARMQPAAVVQPRPNHTPQRKRSKWPWMLLGFIFFFILGLGVGAYAAVAYEWVQNFVAGLMGMPVGGEMMNQAMPEATGGFLEVSQESILEGAAEQ